MLSASYKHKEEPQEANIEGEKGREVCHSLELERNLSLDALLAAY